jgi:uncharacterized membrane protein
MSALQALAQRLRPTHVAIAFVIGIALQVFGFIGIVFWAFWAPFSAWGICGDGASETCLRHHPSIAAHVGQTVATTALWIGQGLLGLATLGLLILIAPPLMRRVRSVLR